MKENLKLHKVFMASLAFIALTQAASAETPITTPGFDLRLGATSAYGHDGYGCKSCDPDWKVLYRGFTVGGFIDAGYRFNHYGLYLSDEIYYAHMKPRKKDDARNKNEMRNAPFIVNRWFIPITDQLAIVPHLAIGYFSRCLGAKIGGGIDYMLTDLFYIMGQVSYRVGIFGIYMDTDLVQAQLGLGLHF